MILKTVFTSIALMLSTSIILPQHPKKSYPIKVASYNIRYNNPDDGENSWSQRKSHIMGLIRYHEFDIFGTQEVLIDQLNDLNDMDEFAHIGVGRDDGIDAGEHSAIFYKKEKFELLNHGDFWLSETPEKPSLGWDATCCYRICSWAKFRDIRSGKVFFFFDVHFDHQGVEARRQSGILMVRKIKEIAGGNPVVCVGDFNSTPKTEQIRTIKSLLHDSREISIAPPYGPVGTFNDFNLNAKLKECIDYIFVSDNILVQKYAVLTDNYKQKYPSDHLPVVANIILE